VDTYRCPQSSTELVQAFFSPEEWYMRMSSSLLFAMVRRLLLDRIEAAIFSWAVSGDSINTGMHVLVAAFPYLDVTKSSIRQPCLNFAVYSSHMLPHWFHQLSVLPVYVSGCMRIIMCNYSPLPVHEYMCSCVMCAHVCL